MPEEILIGFDELAEVGFDVDKVLARAYDATEGEQYEILRDYLYEWDAERPLDWQEDPEAVRADGVVRRVLGALEAAWDAQRRLAPRYVPMRVSWVTRFQHRDGRGLEHRDWDERLVYVSCPGGDAYSARLEGAAGSWAGFCRRCGKFVDIAPRDLRGGTRVRFASGYYRPVYNTGIDVGHHWGTIPDRLGFDREIVTVVMDRHYDLLDEWGNQLIFTGDDFPEIDMRVPYRDVRPPFMQLLDTARPPGED